MFSRYEERCLIKIQIARAKNVRQCHTALPEACGRENLPYRTMARWACVFLRGRKDVHCGAGRPQSTVEQSVRRLVQQDAVDGIRRLPDVWRRVIHVGGDYLYSLKQCDYYKNLLIKYNVLYYLSLV